MDSLNSSQLLPDQEVNKNNLATVHGAGAYAVVSRRKKIRLAGMPRLRPSDFQVIALLGAGDVGSVYLVRKNRDVIIPQAKNEELFAIKCMSL